MANGYIANKGDTWGSISRTLGVTERSLTQRNKGVSNVGAGMVIKHPLWPPSDSLLVRSLRAPFTGGSRTWSEMFAAAGKRSPFLKWVSDRDTRASENLWRNRGLLPGGHLRLFERLEQGVRSRPWDETRRILAPLGDPNADVSASEVYGILRDAVESVTSHVGAGRSGREYEDQGRGYTWQQKYIKPYDAEPQEAAIMSQGIEEQTLRWGKIQEQIQSQEIPGSLTVGEMSKIVGTHGLSQRQLKAFLAAGNYQKVGERWVSAEQREVDDSAWVGSSTVRDFGKLSEWDKRSVQQRGYADIERKGKDGSVYTERRRYDAFGQLKSYAPRAKTKGRLGFLTRRNKRRNRGPVVTTKEQARYYDRRDEWRKNKDKPAETPSAGVGSAYSPQSYGNWANYSQPRSSQVYRNMYDPLGNIDWKID